MRVDLSLELSGFNAGQFESPLEEFEYLIEMLMRALPNVVDRAMDFVTKEAGLNLSSGVGELLTTAQCEDYLRQRLITALVNQQELVTYAPILKRLVLDKAGITEP